MRGVSGNVLSGEISVAAVQKMMLHKRKVKHLKRLYITYVTYCHINHNWSVLQRGNCSDSNVPAG